MKQVVCGGTTRRAPLWRSLLSRLKHPGSSLSNTAASMPGDLEARTEQAFPPAKPMETHLPKGRRLQQGERTEACAGEKGPPETPGWVLVIGLVPC